VGKALAHKLQSDVSATAGGVFLNSTGKVFLKDNASNYASTLGEPENFSSDRGSCRMMRAIPQTLKPMEAKPVSQLPEGPGWLLEPKYDGFRCLVFRDERQIDLRSRRSRPLGRYFPEIVEAARSLPVTRFVLDGELVIPNQPFDLLQLRLHPAASRVNKLAKEHTACFIGFDLLADQQGRSLLELPFREPRTALTSLFKQIGQSPDLVISRATTSPDTARSWLRQLGRGLDGIVAKRLDLPYPPGQRAMQKYKLWHTLDCVVGGLYYKAGTRSVEYLLMGLYDDAGRLNYVGRCGVGANGTELAKLLEPLVGGRGFDIKSPGGKSRWSGREREAVPLEPRLVAEVSADHIEDSRFRHGARLIRWRDDKEPCACTMDQLDAR
jgi:ATP-dependent DNA ligase